MSPDPTRGVQLALGFTVWSVWFVVIYGGLSVGCALAPPPAGQGSVTWINAVLALVTVPTLAWLVWQAWRCARAAVGSGPRFVPAAGAALHAAAAFATAFVAWPIATLPPCV